jgi:adenosylcobinamide kinase/adenosylcobinamide-phosphate guanylyltransferase
VDALLIGTGGARGWPGKGCSCASCMRARAAGLGRAPGQIVVDGALELRPGLPPAPLGPAGHQYLVEEIYGGWDITGPNGERLLAAAGPGAAPEPPEGTEPYNLALIDMLTKPAQLGRLRARGLVHEGTRVVAAYTDDRITSEEEMARRCGLWGVIAGQDQQLVSGPGPAATPATGRPHRTLILGGARSGKSSEAELHLAGEPQVTYLAAGPWADNSWRDEDGQPDLEWAGRVAAHQAARPSWWRTEESLDIAGALRRETGALLIDGIGTWLAAIMDEAEAWPGPASGSPAGPQRQVQAKIDDLIGAWRQTKALVVAVTDQVGSGLVPAYPAGRMFRDELGWLNQRLAAESDISLLVVAGRAMILPA